MKRGLATLMVTVGLPLAAAVGSFEFHKMKLGDLPKEYISGNHGNGGTSTWKITEIELPGELDPKATYKRRILAHTGKNNDDQHYPVLLYGAKEFSDMRLNARVRITGGKGTQAVGICFGAANDKNFFLLALKPSTRRVYATDVQNGAISSGHVSELPVTKDGWYELVITCRDRRVSFLINGKSYPSFDTPTPLKGKVGFWTRADTACEFAKFEVGKPVSIAQQAVQSVSRTNKHVKNLKLFAIADNAKAPSLAASTTGTGIGKPAEEPEDIKKTLTDGTVFYTETKNATQVTMPVRDKDGDIIAAAVINLEKSVLANRDLYRARASAVVIDLGKRIQDKRQLFE